MQLKKYEEDLALAQAIVAPPTQPGAKLVDLFVYMPGCLATHVFVCYSASAVLSDVEMEIGQGNEKIEDMKSDDEVRMYSIYSIHNITSVCSI